MESFKERLILAIKKSGLQQKQVALACHMSEARLSAYVRGVNVPPLDVLVDICRTLGVSADWLLGLSDASPAPGPQAIVSSLTIPRSKYDQLIGPYRDKLDDQFELLLLAQERELAEGKNRPSQGVS